MIITIDGPAGTGKTTVAKRVAERLGFAYFDTGAMYRSVAWLLLENKISLSDLQAIEKALESFGFEIREKNNEKRYFVNDQEVTEAIRSEKINAIVSPVAAMPIVRKLVWKMQHAFGENGNAVFEGRDMGTVVFPNADVKIFLTAKPEIRAKRRLDEIANKSSLYANGMDEDKMLAEIMRRDHYDSSRTLAPLKCPDDAFVIDTSSFSIDEVVDRILKYVENKVSKKEEAKP